MKSLSLVLVSMSILFAMSSAHAKTVSARVSECVASGSPFKTDTCKTTKKRVQCRVEIVQSHFGRVVVDTRIAGVLQAKGSIQSPFQSTLVKGGWVSRREVTYSRLNRGMLQILEADDGTIKKLLALEVYINHDSSGKKYTRYACGTVSASL